MTFVAQLCQQRIAAVGYRVFDNHLICGSGNAKKIKNADIGVPKERGIDGGKGVARRDFAAQSIKVRICFTGHNVAKGWQGVVGACAGQLPVCLQAQGGQQAGGNCRVGQVCDQYTVRGYGPGKKPWDPDGRKKQYKAAQLDRDNKRIFELGMQKVAQEEAIRFEHEDGGCQTTQLGGDVPREYGCSKQQRRDLWEEKK